MENIVKVSEEIRDIFPKGRVESRSETKSKIQRIYKRNGIKANGKASDLGIFGIDYRDFAGRDPNTKRIKRYIEIL